MTARLLIQPKYVAETRVEAIDFSPLLATGQTVSSAVATASVYSGTDGSPQSVVGTITIASPLVNLPLTSGVLGTIYSIRVDATTATPTATLSLSFYLSIIPDLP